MHELLSISKCNTVALRWGDFTRVGIKNHAAVAPSAAARR